jgi:hypothetical protein
LSVFSGIADGRVALAATATIAFLDGAGAR